MPILRYTLLTDGSSDKVLMKILDWLLVDIGVDAAVQGEWADLSEQKSKTLVEKISRAIDLYECDLLFIHRDSESQGRQSRINEIEAAIAEGADSIRCSCIPVIPIRMTEAWLLISEEAIRYAAENRAGKVSLQMPGIGRLENLADPKSTLHDLLRIASQKTGRRLKDFQPHRCVHRIPDVISDFSPLRALSSFKALEEDVRKWYSKL